jgi:hypothetical protein
VLVAGIDRGGYLELDPGRGAGATVEYAGDGFWRIAVTCDTELTGYGCLWDIEVTPLEAELGSVAPEGLERRDSLDRFFFEPGIETVAFVSETGSDIDAFTLETAPGTGVRVDALLDGACAGPFVSWIEYDEIVGSPTQAVDLYPLEP